MATIAAFDKSELNNSIAFVEADSIYVADNGLARAEFKQAGNKVTFQTKGYNIAWTPGSMKYLDETGFEDTIYSVKDAPLEVKGNKARFDRTMPDVDDMFVVDGDRLKHTIIIQGWQRDPLFFLSGKIDFVISGKLEFDASLTIHSMGMHLVGPFETSDAIELRNGDEVIFTLPKIVAYDSNIPDRAETFGRYRVTSNENGTLAFDIVMDNAWMSDPDRVYPILIDPTVVVPSAYETAGNNGRKITMLSNGWLIATAYDNNSGTLGGYRVYKSEDNGATWVFLCKLNSSYYDSLSLVCKGTTVYALCGYSTATTCAFFKFDATTVSAGSNLSATASVDTGQTSVRGATLAISPDGQYLHAAWTSKNSTYPNSYNIRYAKGSIDGSGNVTWVSIEQVTKLNNNMYMGFINPCIVVVSGSPVIFTETLGYVDSTKAAGSGLRAIHAISKNTGLDTLMTLNGWGAAVVYYQTNSYSQNKPCAIVDGIGIIHVAWHGTDSTESSNNIRYSRSLDGGLTFSAMEKLASAQFGPQMNPSLSCRINNDIYVFWMGIDRDVSVSYFNIRRVVYSGGKWSTPVTLTNNSTSAATDPSAFAKETNTMIGWIYMDQNSVKFDSITFNLPPTAPTNLSPNGASVDRSQTQRLSWQYNDSPGDGQSKFDLQWRLVGSSTWNTVTRTTQNQYWDAAANTFPRGNIEWQVRTYDQGGLVSPYSSQATFFAGDKPADPTITGPASPVAIARPTLEWSSFGQASYQVQVLNTTRAVVWDSGEVATAYNARTVGIDLANNTTYILRVRIKNADGIWSGWVERTIAVSYTTPPVPILTVTGKGAEGKITVSINNPTPTGTEPNVTNNDIYRREAGNEGWTRIATSIAPNGSYDDCSVASGVTYEYKVRAYGDNGTFADSTAYAGSIKLNGVWLYCIDDPSGTAHQFVLSSGRSDEWQTDGSLLKFAGRTRPVAEFGEVDNGRITANLDMLRNKGDKSALQTIIQRKTIVCYRDNRGRKMFGVIFQLPSNDTFYGYSVQVSIDEIDYKEDV